MNQICEHTELKQSKDQQAQTDCDENESRPHTGDHRGLNSSRSAAATNPQRNSQKRMQTQDLCRLRYYA